MQRQAELKIELLKTEIENLEGKIARLQEQIDAKKQKISQIEYHENHRGIKKDSSTSEHSTADVQTSSDLEA
jgi:prefoldin subunit 5